MTKLFRTYICTFIVVLCLSLIGSAQTTEITYQGQLQNASAPANGSFDFEFALFDGGGSQIGPVLTRSGVAVANGIFSVNLDFGSSFPGASRLLEIRVRQSGGGSYTTLSPRQPLTSTPYSVKSLTSENSVNADNATNAVTSTNFTGNLSGDVTGTQNSTTVARLQNRNVAATAPAGGQVLKFNSATNQWQPDTDNTGTGGGGGTITGVTPGTGLTGGGSTGNVTVGIANSGVGTAQLADNSVTDAKISSVSGAKVTGSVANAANATTAATATNALSLGGVAANQYLQSNGNGSGLTNLNASNVATGTLSNARLGQIPTANIADSAVTSAKIAGGQVVKSLTVGATTLTDNVTLAGSGNITITPTGNTLTIASTGGASGISGSVPGVTNTIPVWTGGTALGNSLITQSAVGVQLPNGVQLAVGAQGNQLAFGSPNGETGLSISSPNGPRADLRFDGSKLKLVARTAGSGPPSELNGVVVDTAGNVGIGTASLTGARLKVESFSQDAIFGVTGPGFGNGVSGQGTLSGVRGITDTQGGRGVYGIASGSGTGVEGFNNGGNGFGVFSSGFLGTNRLGATSFPNTSLCLNGSNQLSSCNSSSLRYKTNVDSFRYGLGLINRLRPISFDWRSDSARDFGLGAEDVEKVAPQLVFYQDGKVEGVRYDRLPVVLINAIKEQQAQIETLQKANARLASRLLTVEKKLKKSSARGRRGVQ